MNARIPYEACPLCDGREMDEVCVASTLGYPLFRPGLPETQRWVRCRGCGHEFTDGYFTEEALSLLFSESHPGQSPGQDVETQRYVWARTVERVSEMRPGIGGRWLDVGFGNGVLLSTAAELGWEVVGIDLREESVRRLREMGIEAHAAELGRFEPGERFDVVSMADVLEHIPYPKAALQRAWGLLREGGVLFLSTPNSDSVLWQTLTKNGVNPYYAEMEHCHNFGRKRLHGLLEETGFAPRHYGVSVRYRACIEVFAQKVGEGRPATATAAAATATAAGSATATAESATTATATAAATATAESASATTTAESASAESASATATAESASATTTAESASATTKTVTARGGVGTGTLAGRKGEGRLHLGCGRTVFPGWINVDAVAAPGVDLVIDLEAGRLPLPDNSVGEIYASHVLEHIRGALGLMQELHRVAKPGAKAVFRVPYGSSDDADEDPTHVRRYFWGSWAYFGQPHYWRADYGYRGDWDLEEIVLVVDAGLAGKSWEESFRAVKERRNIVSEMVATLRAVKPIRAPLKELQHATLIKFALSSPPGPADGV